MNKLERILAAPGLLILACDAEGVLRYHNPMASERLQLGISSRRTLWDLADPGTVRELLRRVVATVDGQPSVPERVDLVAVGGERVPLLATLSRFEAEDGGQRLRIAGFDYPQSLAQLHDLERSAELLQGFIDTSTEAMWCIEYTEPVDLRQPLSEVTRQIFENDCHWSKCNRAMARLYNLPDGLDFNHQRVSTYCRRSPENEAFVRQLVESNFQVDAAPAINVRHDGSLAYIESNVRCHIEDGKMLRMWGTVRDTTKFRAEHNRLAQRERNVRDILGALPDAILVVDKSKRLFAVNPAFESTFGWRATEVLGKDVTDLINLELGADLELGGGAAQRWFASAQRRWLASVRRRDGTILRCDVRIAPLHDDQSRRFVLAIRPKQPPGRRRLRSPVRSTTRNVRADDK